MRQRGLPGMFVMLLLVACMSAKVTTIPPSHYHDPEHGVSYRVHTRDGATYYVGDFTSDDSTLIILRLRHLYKEDAAPPPTPFNVPLAEVTSVEKIMPSDNLPLVLGGIFLAIAALAAFAAGVGCAGCN